MENAEKTKELLLGYLAVIAAAVLTAVNYELFVFPNSFAPVGINGLITMVQYLFHISIGYLSLLINLPLILLTWKTVNAEYAKKTLTYVLVFSLCSLVLHQWPSFQSLAYHTENGTSSILGPLAAGLINGVVYGLALRHGGSTGGNEFSGLPGKRKRAPGKLIWGVFPH